MESKIGVLALQGDFEAHVRAIGQAGGIAREVRTARDLEGLAALVIPGGESTTMLKLLKDEELFEPLREFGLEKPIFGTCAGAILLASEVLNPNQDSLCLVDMTIERNGYGRQADSRIAHIDTPEGPSEAVFIRAPIIRRVGPGSTVLSKYMDTPVLVRNGRHLIATFHPELSRGANIHRYFIENLAAGRN